jgi:hypothetical protein
MYCNFMNLVKVTALNNERHNRIKHVGILQESKEVNAREYSKYMLYIYRM